MFPDFLIIGAQKAGTTWLDRNLRRHPQIWLPPEKEMHFFDLPPLLPFSALRLAPAKSIRRWAQFRMTRDADKARANPDHAHWYARYYWSPRTERWYHSQFAPAPGQVAGEATPRYAVLPERRIRQARRLMPGCRIIYLLRDPIARAWSDVAMFQSPKFGQPGLQHLDAEAALRFLVSARRIRHSSYLGNLERWEKFFPQEQIFVGFHDEVREAPRRLLTSIYRFLGVDDSSASTRNIIARKVNRQRYQPIPQAFERTLARMLMPEIQALDARFGNKYTAKWRQRAEACL
jgi:hypothetical protein